MLTSDSSGTPITTPRAAQRLAERIHEGAVDRYGAPLLDHVRRVAVNVPHHARVAAWLHEVLECSPLDGDQLRRAGVGADDLEAIRLLTRDVEGDFDPDEYDRHIGRIADACGPAGDLARVVKRADLIDRLDHPHAGAAGGAERPPYRRALRRLERIDAPALSRPSRRGA